MAGANGAAGHSGSSGSSGSTAGSTGSAAVGGGIYVGGGSVTMYNATVALNSGSGLAQGVSHSNVTVYNTIFAGNGTVDVSGGINANYSLFEIAPTGTIVGSNNQVGVDPDLDTALASNGGPTETIALLSGDSPASHGMNGLNSVTLFTDQRGYVPTSSTWDMGAYQFDATPSTPTATLTAANVTVADYGKTSYGFSILYSAPAGLLQSALAGSVVTVVPPSGVGGPITATVGTVTPNGPQDPFGAYQSFTVTYTITPPGGSWLSADNGTYAIDLGGSPITDANGNSIPTGPLGTFIVATGNITITKFGLLLSRATHFYTGTIKLTNNGDAAFSGPLFVLFSLPAGVILENAMGTFGGLPYLEISVGTLAPSASVSAAVAFNIKVDPLSYSTTYYIGSLGA
jgi:hypothetical protein